MEDIPNQIDEPKMSLMSKVLWTAFALFMTIFLILSGIKIFRDNSPSELSQRFVRNNEVIKEKTGGIFKISSFKNGIISGGSREMTGTVYGNENNLRVTVYLFCSKGDSDSAAGCNITGAKYTNDNNLIKDWNDSNWHEIEIDWWEKFFLMFKQ
jgi:hypothetical protein